MTEARTTEADIADEVVEFLESSYPDGTVTITRDLRLLEEGIIDSLGLLELVAFVESRFGIFVDDSDVDLENFGSVGAVAAFVASRNESG